MKKHHDTHAKQSDRPTAAETADETVRTPGEGETAAEESPAQGGHAECEAKYADLNERHLRLMAEYDNFRKRTGRETTELMKRATERLVTELLPVLDNLDRATGHKNDATTLEEYVKGLALIEDQLRDVLAQAGLETMEVVGVEFDPLIHDAVFQMPSDEHPAGAIVSEAGRGYRLNGTVIRHPKVVVSTGAATGTDAGDA